MRASAPITVLARQFGLADELDGRGRWQIGRTYGIIRPHHQASRGSTPTQARHLTPAERVLLGTIARHPFLEIGSVAVVLGWTVALIALLDGEQPLIAVDPLPTTLCLADVARDAKTHVAG